MMPPNPPPEPIHCPNGHKVAERIDGQIVSRHHRRACGNPEWIRCDCGGVWQAPEAIDRLCVSAAALVAELAVKRAD